MAHEVAHAPVFRVTGTGVNKAFVKIVKKQRCHARSHELQLKQSLLDQSAHNIVCQVKYNHTKDRHVVATALQYFHGAFGHDQVQ